MSYWEELERPGPDAVLVDGVEIRRDSRVRLRPRPGGDVLDVALAGRTAVVESVESDLEGNVLLAVLLDDDPGRDLGAHRQPGHRFFFAPHEVEPLPGPVAVASGPRVLVAGIGNVFLGDDGFGVEVVRRLSDRAQPAGVEVADYGIRGMDLACAMQDGWTAVVLVDAAPLGAPPGTLSVIEPAVGEAPAAPDAHGMDPASVLRLVRALGGAPPRTVVVACEPLVCMSGEEPDVLVQLSPPVAAAVEGAVPLVEELLAELTRTEEER
jgi:hydrogenase maturation protease